VGSGGWVAGAGSVATMPRRDRQAARAAAKGKIWKGYRRPIHRDGAFWFAILIFVSGMALQSPLQGWKGGTTDWLVLALEFVVTFVGAFILVGVLAAIGRGFGEGWRSADRPSADRPSSSAPSSKAAPDATTMDRPPLSPSMQKMEKKVRVLGRAVGAARRTYRDFD
jgi:hypothetical protein